MLMQLCRRADIPVRSDTRTLPASEMHLVPNRPTPCCGQESPRFGTVRKFPS